MAIGSPLDTRALELNVKRQWRVWAGRFSSSAYAAHLDIEYNAIRNAAALLDISPLYSYRVSGPDALRLVDRVITRDATRIARGQVVYTPWCDEARQGHRRRHCGAPGRRQLPLDRGGPPAALAAPQRARPGRDRRGDLGSLAALALQGPLSRAVLEAASGADLADLGYFRRRALTHRGPRRGREPDRLHRRPGLRAVGRADQALALWDALMETGRAYALRPAGIWALDVARVEAGLIMLDVDYTAATHAAIPEQRLARGAGPGPAGGPGQGDAVHGSGGAVRERDAGGPPRRLVGLELDWEDLERLTARHGLSPALSPSRVARPDPGVRGRPPDRPGDERHLVADRSRS